jgi:AcrR family transcriptional regulator
MAREKSTPTKPSRARSSLVARPARAPKSSAATKSKRAEQSLKTSERILDAAEELFAQHGLYGVTIREIAKSASVDTALLHYYFGTKNGIFDAVLTRRAEILNKDRMEALDAYESAAGKKATIEGAIAAFLRPVFEWSHRGGRGWKNYCALVAQVNNTPAWGGESMARYFDPVVHRLIAVLRRVLPEARDEDLYWCYHLLSGALTLTLSETGRIDRLSKNACRSSDLEAIEPRMVAYCAAGFRKVCEHT